MVLLLLTITINDKGSAQLTLKVFLDMAPAKRQEVQLAVISALTHYLKSGITDILLILNH
jgi:hypothetical protein